MGLLGNLIAKSVSTALTNSTIKTVSNAAVDVIVANAQKREGKEDTVIKNGVMYIKPTRMSEDYLGDNVIDIAQELLGVGFESITLKPIEKLGERATKKYGQVQSVSINGKDEFLGVKRVPASSYIVIEYLDFRDDVDPEVYAKIKPIIPGVIHSFADIEAMSHKNKAPQSGVKKYCSYCGEQIQNDNARFCSACGKEI